MIPSRCRSGVVDAGEDLALGPVAQQDRNHHIDLPQLMSGTGEDVAAAPARATRAGELASVNTSARTASAARRGTGRVVLASVRWAR